MLNVLIKVASGLTELGVLIFIGIGAVMGGNAAGAADRSVGYVLGGVVGFFVAAIIFGIVAAIFDMQNSLRLLADAAKRTARLEATPAPPLDRKEPATLR